MGRRDRIGTLTALYNVTSVIRHYRDDTGKLQSEDCEVLGVPYFDEDGFYVIDLHPINNSDVGHRFSVKLSAYGIPDKELSAPGFWLEES